MIKCRLIFVLLIFGANLIHAQSDDSKIIIANVGPRDEIILPIVIATEQSKVSENGSSDSLTSLINKLTIVYVSREVYAFSKCYLKEHKMNVSKKHLIAIESTYGSLAIYEMNSDKIYYMANYKKPSLRYLDQFIKALQGNKGLTNIDTLSLIVKLKGFIERNKR